MRKIISDGVVDLFGTAQVAKTVAPVVPSMRAAGIQLNVKTNTVAVKVPNVTGEAKGGHVLCNIEDFNGFIERIEAGAGASGGRPLEVATATVAFDGEGNMTFRVSNEPRARQVEVAGTEIGAFVALLRTIQAAAAAAVENAAS